MEKTGVIIVAGGSGQRCGGGVPKQFRLLGGLPVLARTINLFAETLPGAQVVVVLPAEYTDFWKNLAARFDVAPHTVAEAGEQRFHSVRSGLAALRGGEELIAVQDGVRPLATPAMIRRVIAAAAERGAAIPVTEPVDSFREIGAPDDGAKGGSAANPDDVRKGGPNEGRDVVPGKIPIPATAADGTEIAVCTGGADILPSTDGKEGRLHVCPGPGEPPADAVGMTFPTHAAGNDTPASHVVDRRRLRIVQTPQVFQAGMLRAAYRAPYEERFTDDASVVERAGYPVFLVRGERTNLKLTEPDDFTLAEAILAARQNEITDEERTDADDL